MGQQNAAHGVVYTETVVFAPPEQYAADAPYQLAIIELADHTRSTVRIVANQLPDRVKIGDKVSFLEEKDGVAYYKKSTAEAEDASDTTRPLT